jgi:hypothetical protein
MERSIVRRERMGVVAKSVRSRADRSAEEIAEELIEALEGNAVLGFAYTRRNNSLVVNSVRDTHDSVRPAGGEAIQGLAGMAATAMLPLGAAAEKGTRCCGAGVFFGHGRVRDCRCGECESEGCGQFPAAAAGYIPRRVRGCPNCRR